jgi:hypothetical protein
MRTIRFDDPAEFHCPLTGVRLWCEGEVGASPATRFIYIEPHQAFRYLDKAFAKAITKVDGPFLIDGNEGAYFRRLCRKLKGDQVIDFVLYYDTAVVHLGIDTFYGRPPQKKAIATQPEAPPQDAGIGNSATNVALPPRATAATMAGAFDYQHVMALWKSAGEAASWGPVDWIVGFRSRPELVMLGADEENGGEVYAIMDIMDGRILDCDELPAHEVERLDTILLWPTEQAASQG